MRFSVFNKTDGIPAFPEPFKTHAAAVKATVEFRKRFSVQGYYLTAGGERIDPADVKLEIQEVRGE